MIDHITQLRAQEAGLPAAESHPDPPLASYPLRIDWERTVSTAEVLDEWPAPEMAATEVEPAEYKARRAVADLVKFAGQFGWRSRVTLARGSYSGVGQRPSRPRASYAVRMWRGADRAVAVYVEGPSEGAAWAWDFMCHWSSAGTLTVSEQVGLFMVGVSGPIHDRPSLKDAGLGPMHGPKIMPRGFLAKIGPIHGPDLPPGFR